VFATLSIWAASFSVLSHGSLCYSWVVLRLSLRLDWPPSCLTFVPSLSDRVFSLFFFFLFWCCPTAGFPSSTRSASLVPHLCALTFRYEFLLLKFCVCCDFCSVFTSFSLMMGLACPPYRLRYSASVCYFIFTIYSIIQI
jgi:hypothetical protein